MNIFLKKIFKYSLFFLIVLICLVYFQKLSTNLIKFIDIQYLIISVILLIIFIKFFNFKFFLNKIFHFIFKLNSIYFKNISLLTIIISVVFIISAFSLNKLNIATNYYQRENYFIIYFILKFNLFFCLLLSLISTSYYI